jgi:Isochorismatase family
VKLGLLSSAPAMPAARAPAGAEFVPEPGKIVATEHWCYSGFANTDLDLQLKNHGIHQLIVGGLFGRDDARGARHQHAELRHRYCYDKGSHRLYFLSSPSQAQRGRDGLYLSAERAPGIHSFAMSLIAPSPPGSP